MTNSIRNRKQALLQGSANAAVAAMAISMSMPAIAQVEPSVNTTSQVSLGVKQEFNEFNSIAAITLDGNTGGSIVIGSDDGADGTSSVANSTLTVGTSSATRNTATAAGYANDATLTVNSAINNQVGTGTATATFVAPDAVTAANSATVADSSIALLQSNLLADATIVENVDMGISIDGASNSSLQVQSNVQEGVGLLNSAVSTLNSSGTNTTGSASISSVQLSTESDLSVSTDSVDAIEVALGDANSVGLLDSTAALTGNSKSSVAVGNEGSSSQTVSGANLALLGAGSATVGVEGYQAEAGYATLSVQSLTGNGDGFNSVSATTAGDTNVVVQSTVENSTVRNDSNSATATARGNEVVNSTSLGTSSSPINSIVTGTFADAADQTSAFTASSGGVAAIASGQNLLYYNVSASALTSDGVANAIDGAVQSSTVSASSNTINADAGGNRASNLLTANASSIDTSGSIGEALSTVDNVTSTAAFTVANGQVTNFATVTADLSASGSNASVSNDIGGVIDNATLSANSNQLLAMASANNGSNSLSLSGTNLSPTAAVSNGQYVNGDVTAIGAAGQDVANLVGGSVLSSTVAASGNTVSADAAGNRTNNSLSASGTSITTASANSAQATVIGSGADADAAFAVANSQYLDGNILAQLTDNTVEPTSSASIRTAFGGSVDSSTVGSNSNLLSASATGNLVGANSNSLVLTGTDLATTAAVANGQIADGTINAVIGTIGTDGTAGSLGTLGSGVAVTVGGDITSSTVTVNGNATSGSATANRAANRLIQSGTNLAAGDLSTVAVADAAGVSAAANNALTNRQVVDTASIDTSVTTTYAVLTEGAGASGGAVTQSNVVDSALSVSNNSASATSTGNTASNGLGLTGTSIATNSALVSAQDSLASVSAESALFASAPAANTNSTLNIDGNANLASAVINTASNTVQIASSTDLLTTGTGADAILSANATGDHVLNNYQSASTSVNALAETALVNEEIIGGWGSLEGWGSIVTYNPAAGPTDGIQNSSVSVSGNTTNAQALANKSANSLSLSANNDTASAGLLNEQNSSATVGATATTIAFAGVEGANVPNAVNSSSVTFANNATVARAGGNTASNTLSASATQFAVNDAATTDVALGSTGNTVQEGFAILNSQSNSGAGVSANASVMYGAGFSTLSTPAVDVQSSTVVLNGNSAAAVAYGNQASNDLTLTALNMGGTQAAVGNQQLNTANVSATTSALVFAGAGSNGGVAASQLAVSRNALSAVATGNSNTSVVTVSANAANYLLPRQD